MERLFAKVMDIHKHNVKPLAAAISIEILVGLQWVKMNVIVPPHRRVIFVIDTLICFRIKLLDLDVADEYGTFLDIDRIIPIKYSEILHDPLDI